MFGASLPCPLARAKSNANNRRPLEKLEQQLELSVVLEDYEEARAGLRDQIRGSRRATRDSDRHVGCSPCGDQYTRHRPAIPTVEVYGLPS